MGNEIGAAIDSLLDWKNLLGETDDDSRNAIRILRAIAGEGGPDETAVSQALREIGEAEILTHRAISLVHEAVRILSDYRNRILDEGSRG